VESPGQLPSQLNPAMDGMLRRCAEMNVTCIRTNSIDWTSGRSTV